MLAHFRGGPDGSALQSTDLTSVRQWGHQLPAATAHGKLDAQKEFTLRVPPGHTAKIVRTTLASR